MNKSGGDKLFYSIGEVSEMTGLKPHVLRYWQTEFPSLNPSKNQSGNRMYRAEDIVQVKLIKKLLYDEKYSIPGAKIKIEEMNRDDSFQMEFDLDTHTVPAELIQEVCTEIKEMVEILDRDPMEVDSGWSNR